MKNFTIGVLLCVVIMMGLRMNTEFHHTHKLEQLLEATTSTVEKYQVLNQKNIAELDQLRNEILCVYDQIDSTRQENKTLQEQNNSLVDFIQRNHSVKTTKMKASAYTAAENGGYNKTSTGKVPRPKHTIAVSRDRKDLIGKKIRIHGWGDGVVEDLMGPRWSNKLDIFTSSTKEAMNWGIRTVSVTVLPDKKEDIHLLSELGLM